jgi:TetR/AcrR family transcriptional repressor of nem operon
MPWEKSFDADKALSRAMGAFWARGYEATSMQDLVDCMGIGRGSLYAAFGGKRSLFIQALRRYDRDHRRDWTERLAASGSPKDAILGAFRAVVAQVIDAGRRDGCLLINTALELSPHDEEIGRIVRECLAEMEAFFREQLEKGQAIGEIPSRLSPDATAKALLALFVSLRVFSRARPEPTLLESVAGQAEALIS